MNFRKESLDTLYKYLWMDASIDDTMETWDNITNQISASKMTVILLADSDYSREYEEVLSDMRCLWLTALERMTMACQNR